MKAQVPVLSATKAGLWDDPELSFDGLRILKSVDKPWIIGSSLGFTLPLSGRLGVERARANVEGRAALVEAWAVEQEIVSQLETEWADLAAAMRALEATKSAQRELGEVVRKKQPRWEISAAVFPDLEQNLRVKQQDWKTWAQNGYVDALLPMLYSTNFQKVETWAKDFKKDLAGTKTRVYPAFFIGHFYKAGAKNYNADYLDLEKKLKFDGFGVFAAQSLTDDLIERLAKRN